MVADEVCSVLLERCEDGWPAGLRPTYIYLRDGTGLQIWIGLKKASMNESVSVPKVVSKEVQPRLTYFQSSPNRGFES